MEATYKVIAANTSNVAVGASKAGDVITRIVVVPTSELATGTVSIKDGTDSEILVYGADSTINPVTIELGIQAKNSGGWTVTTGTGITAIVIWEG